MGRTVVPAVWLGVFAIAAVGAAARALVLFRPVGYDEAYTYLIYASVSLPHVIGSYYPNNHVLHTLAMAASAALFGSDPWALRLPAFAAGIACIPSAFLLGRRLHGDGAGLVAAALMSGSSVMIEYSTNGRGYSMIVLATLLLFLAGTRLLAAAGRRWWVLGGIVAALGLFTVPVMAFAIAAWNIWLVASTRAAPPHHRAAIVWSLAAANLLAASMTLLLYTPAILSSGVQALVSNQWVLSLPLHEVLPAIPGLLARLFVEAGRDWPLGASAVVVTTIAACASTRAHPSVRLLVPAALLAVVALVVAQRVVPLPRMLITLLPILYVTSACGIAVLASRAVRGAARGAVAAAAVSTTLAFVCAAWVLARATFPLVAETGAMPAAPQVASYLEAHLDDGDVVLVLVPGNVPLWYYLTRRGVPTAHLSLAPTDWLHRGLDSARRVYLVVNAPVESLPDVDNEMAEAGRRFGPPRLVAEFPHASVHVRDAIDTDAPR